MPLLFALGQHAALCAVDNSLGPQDGIFAFLDDVYIVTALDRLLHGYGSLAARVVDTFPDPHSQREDSGMDFSDVLERIAQRVEGPDDRMRKGSGLLDVGHTMGARGFRRNPNVGTPPGQPIAASQHPRSA